jgi:Flp pilus assembly protein TadG
MRLISSIRGGRKLRCERGQSLVEFSFVAFLFFLMLFGIMDFGRLFFTQMTLQNAVRQAGRFAVTGNHIVDPATGNTMSRVDSITQIAKNAASGLNVSSIQISSANGGSSGAARAGGPRDTVTISLTTNFRFVTPMIGAFFGTNGVYQFTVKCTFLNEPFASTSTT